MRTKSNAIRPPEALKLFLRKRVAWCTSVYSQVLVLYSSYFQRTFHQKKAVDLGWQIAFGQFVDTGKRQKLIKRIEGLQARAGNEDYPENLVLPGSLILHEVDYDDAKAASFVVDYAAANFAACACFIQGVNPLDKHIRRAAPDYFNQVEIKVHQLARETYDDLLSWTAEPTDRARFQTFVLDSSFPLLPNEVIEQATWPPPLHERASLDNPAR